MQISPSRSAASRRRHRRALRAMGREILAKVRPPQLLHSAWNASKYGYSLCPCPCTVEAAVEVFTMPPVRHEALESSYVVWADTRPVPPPPPPPGLVLQRPEEEKAPHSEERPAGPQLLRDLRALRHAPAALRRELREPQRPEHLLPPATLPLALQHHRAGDGADAPLDKERLSGPHVPKPPSPGLRVVRVPKPGYLSLEIQDCSSSGYLSQGT